MNTREELLRRVGRILREIEQIERDVAHWNRIHPEESPIDADPDGELAEWKARLSEAMEDLRS
jgi:hypothetical protein